MDLELTLDARGLDVQKAFDGNAKALDFELTGDKLKVKLGRALKAGEPITEDMLVVAGLVRRKRDGVRLLANGEVKAAITIHVTGASKAATPFSSRSCPHDHPLTSGVFESNQAMRLSPAASAPAVNRKTGLSSKKTFTCSGIPNASACAGSTRARRIEPGV